MDGGHANGASPSGARQAISDDGRFVIFTSRASNLVPGDSNLSPDVFVRDRLLGRTERVSVSDGGRQASGSSGPMVALSPGGRFAYFASAAPRLVAGDEDGFVDLFVRDRLARRTIRLSVDDAGRGGGGQAASATWQGMAISGSGLTVAFASEAANLAPGGDGSLDIYVRGPCDGRDPAALAPRTATPTAPAVVPTPTVLPRTAARIYLPWAVSGP